MSTLTKIWTEEKIRNIIRHLDEKTGLNGASLPIKLASHGNALGYYQYVGEKMFGFKPKFFNDPNTKEAAAIDVIRHEYAHYYVDVTGISKFFTRKGSSRNHNTDWKWACKMVGANPNSYYQPEYFESKNWKLDDAVMACNADDVEQFDVISYLNRWHKLPIDPDTANRINARIKERTPNSYFEIGDEVVHPAKGFGIVHDVIPYDYFTQKIYVCFEDGSSDIFTAPEICKIVDGVAITYRRK